MLYADIISFIFSILLSSEIGVFPRSGALQIFLERIEKSVQIFRVIVDVHAHPQTALCLTGFHERLGAVMPGSHADIALREVFRHIIQIVSGELEAEHSDPHGIRVISEQSRPPPD